MKVNLYNVRQDYAKQKLAVNNCHENPLFQFRNWLNEAIKSKVNEPTAMNIATVDKNNRPSARMVLLKELDDAGFVFFTNYNSRKGQALSTNPNIAITFFWPELERQVRIEGRVEFLAASESDEYFASRPYKSQIGAWVSKQSKKLRSKTSLLAAFAFFRAKNPGKVKRPAFWGGYRVLPDRIEFWQGRPSRLHDRIEYILQNGHWDKHRLSP